MTSFNVLQNNLEELSLFKMNEILPNVIDKSVKGNNSLLDSLIELTSAEIAFRDERARKINITVSGVNKKTAVPYLVKKYGDKIFDAFKENLTIPAEHTGKMTHTYIDDERRGILIDWTGQRGEYDELSSVHLENAEYSLSIAEAYVNFLKGFKEYES